MIRPGELRARLRPAASGTCGFPAEDPPRSWFLRVRAAVSPTRGRGSRAQSNHETKKDSRRLGLSAGDRSGRRSGLSRAFVLSCFRVEVPAGAGARRRARQSGPARLPTGGPPGSPTTDSSRRIGPLRPPPGRLPRPPGSENRKIRRCPLASNHPGMVECDLCLSMSRSGAWNDGVGPCGERRPGVRRSRGEAGRAERSAGAGPRVDADRGPRTSDRSAPRASDEASAGGRIEMTREVLADFKVIRRLLGPSQPVGDEERLHKRQ